LRFVMQKSVCSDRTFCKSKRIEILSLLNKSTI